MHRVVAADQAGYGTLAVALAGWTMAPAVVLIALGGLVAASAALACLLLRQDVAAGTD